MKTSLSLVEKGSRSSKNLQYDCVCVKQIVLSLVLLSFAKIWLNKNLTEQVDNLIRCQKMKPKCSGGSRILKRGVPVCD